jgi:Heterokaryon incompatibility protein (HET)
VPLYPQTARSEFHRTMSSSQSSESPYQQRLQNRAIRLLRLHPGYPTEKIECSLIIVQNVDEAPPYDAMSYVWGTKRHAESIICNGVEMMVTENLFSALHHLRPQPSIPSEEPWDRTHPLHSSRNCWKNFAKHRREDQLHFSENPREIWVDALCIDQRELPESRKERSNQIKLMGTIYEGASSVRIWLGKDILGVPVFRPPELTSTLSTGLKGIRPRTHIGAYNITPVVLSFISQALRNIDGGENPLINLKRADDFNFRNEVYGFPPPSAPEWNALRVFFENPWFARVWVVQEAVLARNAIAMLGDWEIQWTAIGQAATWFQDHGYELPDVKYSLPSLRDLVPVSNAAATWEICTYHPGPKVPLLHLLKDSRARIATNYVDKLYATYGLAEEIQSNKTGTLHPLIEPNYESTVEQVYKGVAKFLIICHGNLDILSYAGGAMAPAAATEIPKFPSWVPIWYLKKFSMEFASPRTSQIYRTDNGEPLHIGGSVHDDSLTIKGFEFDNINRYGERLMSYGFGPIMHQEERQFILAALRIVTANFSDRAMQYGSEPELLQAFTRTLTAGLSRGYKAASEDANHHEDTCRWLFEHLGTKIPVASPLKRAKWSLLPSIDSGRFQEIFVRTCMDRRFFVTKGGYMGVGPETMKQGDIIAVLFGGRVPFVLRPVNGHYRFLGDGFVDGIMTGEATRKWKTTTASSTFFDIR